MKTTSELSAALLAILPKDAEIETDACGEIVVRTALMDDRGELRSINRTHYVATIHLLLPGHLVNRVEAYDHVSTLLTERLERTEGNILDWSYITELREVQLPAQYNEGDFVSRIPTYVAHRNFFSGTPPPCITKRKTTHDESRGS